MTAARDLARLAPLPTDPAAQHVWTAMGWQALTASNLAGLAEALAAKQDLSAPVAVSASRALNLADAGKYLRATAAATLTVPTNASVAFPVGTEVTLRAGAGNLIIAAAGGVTLNAPSGGTLVLSDRMTVTLKKVGTNEWDVIGQTVAA